MTEDYTAYDPDEDVRETAHGHDTPTQSGAVPLVTGEAPWLLQVSIKTPAGALINIRGMEATDIRYGLSAIRAMADEIVEVEALFSPARAIAAPVPPSQYQQPQQPQYQQQQQYQQRPQQGGGPVPNCQCGFPARFVAGGTSTKTGRPYRAFYACGNPNRGAECGFRADA